MILVIALIGYGTSWAYSGYMLDDVDHMISSLHEHTQTESDANDCDHCCHASAHMIGLPPFLPKLTDQPLDSYRLNTDCSITTRLSAPLLKPPRA